MSKRRHQLAESLKKGRHDNEEEEQEHKPDEQRDMNDKPDDHEEQFPEFQATSLVRPFRQVELVTMCSWL